MSPDPFLEDQWQLGEALDCTYDSLDSPEMAVRDMETDCVMADAELHSSSLECEASGAAATEGVTPELDEEGETGEGGRGGEDEEAITMMEEVRDENKL